MKKYTKEYCKQNKVAIIVNSSEEVIQVAKIFGKYHERNGWWSYFYDAFRHANNEHCISYNNGYGVHASKEYYDTKKEYEVITFQQFIQDNEEFVLPEKWHIVVYNTEEANVYRKFFNEKANTYWDYFFNYVYGFNGKQYVAAERNTEITFEQFKKYVLKKETNMKDKEIIGYKLIKPEFRKAVNFMLDRIGNVLAQDGITKDYTTQHLLKDAGVLDIWFEKIYTPEKPVEVMVDMGSFKLKVIKDGIFHKTEDITNFVQNLHDVYTKLPSKFGSYDCIVDEITFKKTGCENNKTSLKQWVTAYTEYLKLKN